MRQVTVARDPFVPANLIVDEEHAYWVSRDETPHGTSRSRIMRARKDGSELTILAEGVNIESLAADSAYLYGTDRGAPRHEETECDRFEVWDATCRTVEPGVTVCDDTLLPPPESEVRKRRGARTAASGSVLRVAKHGGGAVALARHRDEPGAIGVVGGRVYWLENRARDPRRPWPCGEIMTLDATAGGLPRPETERSHSRDRDRFIGPAIQLAVSAGGPEADDAATWFALGDRQNIAYRERHCPQGPPCGGPSAIAAGEGRVVVAWEGKLSIQIPVYSSYMELAIPTATPTGIAVDDRYVYWVVDHLPQRAVAPDDLIVPVTDRGELWRVAHGGGAPERLAEGLDGPRDVALDGDHVYWIESRARTIVRVDKP
jgi:hypothetical protein